MKSLYRSFHTVILGLFLAASVYAQGDPVGGTPASIETRMNWIETSLDYVESESTDLRTSTAFDPLGSVNDMEAKAQALDAARSRETVLLNRIAEETQRIDDLDNNVHGQLTTAERGRLIGIRGRLSTITNILDGISLDITLVFDIFVTIHDALVEMADWNQRLYNAEQETADRYYSASIAVLSAPAGEPCLLTWWFLGVDYFNPSVDTPGRHALNSLFQVIQYVTVYGDVEMLQGPGGIFYAYPWLRDSFSGGQSLQNMFTMQQNASELYSFAQQAVYADIANCYGYDYQYPY